MAERRASIVVLGPPIWRLRLLDARCSSCALGCGGRCNAFASDGDGELELSLSSESAPVGLRVGDAVILTLDDALLRRGAWMGYGRVWFGLVLGSALGFGIGRWFGINADVTTLAGLVLGTSVAVIVSKHGSTGPRLVISNNNDNEPT